MKPFFDTFQHQKNNQGKREFIMFEKVRDIIVDTLSCDADKVTMEASLADDLGADSLDAVELNMALEDNLGVAISDEELANMKTVGDIVNYLEANA